MSVCAKFQLSSWSRSDGKVCAWWWGGGGFHVSTMSNPTKLLLQLLLVELSYVGFWQYILACSKFSKSLIFILQIFPRLCIYVRSHQKKFQDFRCIILAGPSILSFRQNYKGNWPFKDLFSQNILFWPKLFNQCDFFQSAFAGYLHFASSSQRHT